MNFIQGLIAWVLNLGCFAIELWAFVDVVARPPKAFVAEDRLTKPIWLGITGAASIIGLLSLLGMLGSGPGLFSFLGLVAVIAAAVYLTWARPSLKPYGGRLGGRKPPGGQW